MKQIITLLSAVFLIAGCMQKNPYEKNYFDYSDDLRLNAGTRMIEISTPKGEFNVWTRQVGNNPDMKVLILHGGPGMNHEAYEAFDSYFPEANIQYYYYDQLGSAFSDQPSDQNLWTIDRFVDEVEQVRKALGLNKDNFYLYGHSWGGILAMEYAFAHQENLKGLIISNMMSSVPAYNEYAENVLAKQLDPDILSQLMEYESNEDYENPEYMELLMQYYYTEHVLRMPVDEWPEPVLRGFERLNPEVYVYMQGPSEFGITEDATLFEWDRTDDLDQITVPTLVIGAEHDTMDPDFMEMMAGKFPKGHYLYCPKGSHMAMYDDQETYFKGMISFIKNANMQ